MSDPEQQLRNRVDAVRMPPVVNIIALQEYARRAYDNERRRFEWAETKIGNYMKLLAVILGGAAVGASQFQALWRAPAGLAQHAFVVGFAVSFIAALLAMVAALTASQTRMLGHEQLDDDLVMSFVESDHREVMRTIGVEYILAARGIRHVNQRRFHAVTFGFWCLCTSLTGAAVALASYLFFE